MCEKERVEEREKASEAVTGRTSTCMYACVWYVCVCMCVCVFVRVWTLSQGKLKEE